MRLIGDPPADAMLEELAHTNPPALDALRYALDSGAPLPSVEPVSSFLQVTMNVPDIVDPVAIMDAQTAFSATRTQLLRLLGLGSLPDSYCNRSAARTLALTSRLARDPERRIYASVQMVSDVFTRGGLEPAGRGIDAVLRVRLRHAVVRRFAREAHGDRGSVALNQEDLAATLLTFSWRLLPRFERSGGSWDGRTQRAYVRTWSAIGLMLGIDPRLVPFDDGRAAILQQFIERRHYGPCPEGQELTRVLVRAYDRIQSPPFVGFTELAIRFYLGDRLANMLAV